MLSVFQTTTAFSNVSNKYVTTPTLPILDALVDRGFIIRDMRASRTRNPDREPFVKHQAILRLRQSNLVKGDLTGEIALTNAHDGTSALGFDARIHRLVCDNGMAVPYSWLPAFRFRHIHQPKDWLEGVFSLVDQLPKMLERIDAMRYTLLARDLEEQFVERAWALRSDTPAPLQALMQPRRAEDAGASLFNIYQKVQEHLIKGGIRPLGKKRVTRTVKSLVEDRRINQQLLLLAEEYAA